MNPIEINRWHRLAWQFKLVVICFRYQCLRCLNYDLCQNCFFHGVVSRYHKLWHPIQEYCTRGTRRDETRALLKVLSNHLSLAKRRKEKRNIRRAKQLSSNSSKNQLKEKQVQTKTSKITQSQRYLPHDPKLEKEASTNEKGIEKAENTFKVPESVVDGVTEEDGAASTTILRQEGNAIIATDHHINISSVNKETVDRNRGAEHEQQAKLFNSIVIHLEEQNHQIMKKLQLLQSQQINTAIEQEKSLQGIQSFVHQQPPLDSCQNMQHQLQRLKGLVDNIFGANVSMQSQAQECVKISSHENPDTCDSKKLNSVSVAEGGKERQSHDLTVNSSKRETSIHPNLLVESTPLCNYQRSAHLNKLREDNNCASQKLLSRSTIHNEFSPIIPNGRQYDRRKKLELDAVNESTSRVETTYPNKYINRTNSIIAPESIAVENLLNEHKKISHLGEVSQNIPHETSQYENINSTENFPFSRMSLNELTSLLVKTGKIVPNGDSEYFPGQEISPPYSVTRLLDPKSDASTGNASVSGGMKTEIMEELESLMLRLENVFDAYHSGEGSEQDIDKIKRINSVHLQQLQKEQDPMIVGQIVSEIVDQIHSFNYRCLGAARTQSQPSSSPSIARSEGDGLSSPEPPVVSLSSRSQCVN